MATTSSSFASTSAEIDLPEEFKIAARKQVEVKLRPLVDDAKRERDTKLASAKDDQERKQVAFDYEQQVQSVRAIAEDYYKDTLLAERKRRIGRLNPQVEVSVEQQQAILDAIKGGSGDSAQESQQTTAASGAWNAADRNGHSVSDAANFGERRYAYSDLPAVSTSLEDSSTGPYASQDPPAVSRKVSSGSMSSMRSRTDGSRPAASPLDGPSGSRAYGYALSGSPGPTARRDSASSSGLRNAMNPSSSYNAPFAASNLTRRDSNVSIGSSKSGGGPVRTSFTRRESRTSPMVETARSPSQMTYSSGYVPGPGTTVTSVPAASTPPPVTPSPPTVPPPPPPPAPPPPPVPVTRPDFRSGISTSAPRSRSPLGLRSWSSVDDSAFPSANGRNVREEPRPWDPYPRGKDVSSHYIPRNVRHTSSSGDIRADSRPSMPASPMPVTSPDSEFPPSPEAYAFRPGSRASNSTDGERRVGVPIPGKSRRALHAPQGSPEFVRTMARPPSRRQPYDVLESTRYASKSPETTRMPYGSVPPPIAIARRNSGGSHRSARSSRSQSSRPIYDEWMRPGTEMETYEEQLSPATTFDVLAPGWGGMFAYDDDCGENIEDTEDKARQMRLWEERLESRENDVFRDEEELKQKLTDMEQRLAELQQKVEDGNRLESIIKRKEDETRRREDETKRKEDAVNRRENELREREQEVRDRVNEVRKWEEDVRKREDDARQRELDARGKEEDAKKREFDARKREEDVRAKVEEARLKAEEARQGMEALREKEEELESAEDDLEKREEELQKKETQLHELEIVLENQRQEIQRQLQDCRAKQSTVQADRDAFEERQRAEEVAKAQHAREVAEARHAAAIAKEEAVKAREEEVRKREQELVQQAQRQKEEELRTAEALGRIAEQERRRPEDFVKEQERRFEELNAKREAERRAQAAAEEAQREEQQRQAMLAEHERQARARIVAEEEARQKMAELAEQRRQEAKAADAERRQQEAQRQAEERRRQNSGGGTNPDTARSGTPHSTSSAWPNNRNSTASTGSSATSSSWSSSAGSGWSSWGTRSNGTSTTNASGASRSSASTPSTARPAGNGWKGPAGAASSTTESSPRKATADEDVRAWQERQEEHAARQAEQFKKEQERLEKERQAKAAGRMMTKQEYLRLVDDHERQWSQLQAAASISWDSIPWPMLRKPHTPEEITTAAIAGYVLNTYSSGERSDKERLKEHLRRWHPDRFETKLLPKVSSSDRDRVQEGAGHVIRSLNELSTRSS